MPRNIQGSADQRKAIRLSLLSSTDWYSTRQRDQEAEGITPTLTPEQWSECLVYRQALRDWPVSGDYNEPYPTKPGWMS